MANVELKNIRKSYGKMAEVVHGINLEIKDNEFVVLVGPSGCGKSTTLRMIAGLEEITSGELRINGELVNNASPRERGIAMVFQNYALYPHMSVYDNIAFGLRLQKFSKEEIDKRVIKAAEVLGLTPYLHRKPKELSGGQRQRVAMGRATAKDADVFLFDEPLSNLDAKLRNEMRTEIKRRHLEDQRTTIYVTHDQIEAMTLADRLVILRNGYIEQIGTPMEVFETPNNKFVASFIGSPAMNFFDLNVKYTKDEEFIFCSDDDKLWFQAPKHVKKFIGNRKKVIMGIRPSDIFISTPNDNIPEEWKFKGEVELAELLGKNALLSLKIGKNRFTGEVMGQKLPKVGETVKLSWNLCHINLFDSETEKSIL
ncbi:MAG: ABC transporter ATP-binding protein [Bacteriovoracia bacterium]